MERGKSAAIAVLSLLLGLSLLQISLGNAGAAIAAQDRVMAAEVARRFAIALTTYDYAHPALQLALVRALSSASVSARVTIALTDEVALKSSSLGDAAGVTVLSSSGSSADVIVNTSQVVSGAYVPTGSRLAGLLDVSLSRSGTRWVVIDYHWLLVPSS